MDEDQKNLPLPQKDLPLPEKELPAPHDMLLPKPTFWDKHAPSLHPVLMVLIFSFLVADIFYFSYLALQGKKTESPPPEQAPIIAAPSPTLSTDPTADWKTYTNTKYGYSLKYPLNWEVRFGLGQLGTTGDEANTGTTYLVKFNPAEQPKGYWAVSVTVDKTDLKTPEELLNRFKNPPEKPSELASFGSEEPIQLGELHAVRYDSGGPGHSSKDVLAIKDGYSYTISLDLLLSKELMPFYDQILSTFKFLDQNNIQTACTDEAKICPDGSSVGRTGPDCEFEACP